jgi:hypothetical protein
MRAASDKTGAVDAERTDSGAGRAVCEPRMKDSEKGKRTDV